MAYFSYSRFLSVSFKSFLLIFLISCCTFLSSCEESTKIEEQPKIITPPKVDTVEAIIVPPAPQPPVFDSTYDRIASYIAGIRDSSLSSGELIRDSVWEKYADSMDKSWQLAREKRYNMLEQWADSESLVQLTTDQVLLYPFSGPDFLNAHTFFPHCKKYILAGLEPVGQLPHMKTWKSGSRYSYLSSVSISLKDILMSSFFHTKKMKVQFKKENINGALPLLSIFLKRTGHTITNIEGIQITRDSGMTAFAYDSLLSSKFKANGVKLTFMDSNSYDQKEIFFFSQDLSNSGVAEGTGFKNYLDSLNGYFTFVKSASYLMHYDYFSNIRSSILAHAQGIFQDDTGIPYRKFEPENWEIKLYGQYSKPGKPFLKSVFFQKDLQKTYKEDTASIEKLPFPLGYHQEISKTNLLIATRK